MIPSKVPLGESFNDCVKPGKRYSFKQVIHQQRLLGRKLGLVIDLSNSSRYYTTSDLNKEGIKHVKIPCKRRDSVPDNKSVNMFVYEVIQFLSRQKQHTKKYVLVHCTHGHNRTGYMIVHFLMRGEHSSSVTEAVKMFSDARPPGIYKPDYIDALYAFYHEKKLQAVVCPPTPEWKRSSDLDVNGEAVLDDDDDDDGGSTAPVREKIDKALVMTNDDILGDEIPYDQERGLKELCYQLLDMKWERGNLPFPGSHPVSFNRKKLEMLRQHYYYATWKADGTRYMMLKTTDGCYLIDRNFKIRRVQIRIPCNYALLDGEMIIDTVPNSQKQERRYLIYDMMAINHFHERFKMIGKEVIEPRNYERQNIYQSRNPHYRYDMEPFGVRRKDFWLLSTVTTLLNKFIPRLSHNADGLIFQCRDDAYVPYTHEGLLKWKYPEMNSVDFLFELGEDDSQILLLFDQGKRKIIKSTGVKFRDDQDPSFYSGKIIKCSWDSAEKKWVFMRIRTDKTTPNDFNTNKKVMHSIEDNITEEDLVKQIHDIISLPG